MAHMFQDQLLNPVHKSEYNAACTAGMALAYFRMLIHEFLNKDPDIVPEEAPMIVLDSKSSIVHC